MQVTDSATSRRIIALVESYGRLPTVKIDGKRILKRLLSDKKTVGGVPHFVLPTAIGKVNVVSDVPARLVTETVKHISRMSKA
jgi:3-dehydroquinate synthase